MHLGPPQAFGAAAGPVSLMCIPDYLVGTLINGNSGLYQYIHNSKLQPLEMRIESESPPRIEFGIAGDRLHCEFECNSLDDLESMIFSIVFFYVPLLNLESLDPPVVICVSGSAGRTEFRWEHLRHMLPMNTTTEESLINHMSNSYKNLDLVGRECNRRLAVALSYFYVAARLLVVGQSRWEFMAECVLNLSKTLEILFGGTRDKTRTHLAALE